tara:strand:+ start:1266 stop:2186 length:921 start_codon:yes stop_codon:yes gene_type:complete
MSLNGIIFINKKAGISSAGVVRDVKKIVQCKVGHGGTLDPIATGVLPILIGEGTKFGSFSLQKNKTYNAELLLGVSTDTGDKTGTVLEEKNIICTKGEILKVLKKFSGKYSQTVPSYSAVKVRGVPMYKLARRGITTDKIVRQVEITDLKLVALTGPRLELKVTCSKGTYIRSLATDIGEMLGCGAHITNLERSAVGEFSLRDAFTLDNMTQDLKRFGKKILDEKYIRPVDLFLKDFRSLDLSEKQLGKIVNGVEIEAPFEFEKVADNIVLRLYDDEKKFIGLAETKGNKIFPKRLIGLKNMRKLT